MGSKKKVHKKNKKGLLIGIPLLLFLSGVVLISLAFFDNIKYAYSLSRLFIPEEVTIEAASISEDTDKGVKLDGSSSFPKFGEEYAELTIPSADIKVPVYVGDKNELLLTGAGQYYGSKFPGDGGNTVLLGHKNSLFKTLGQVEIGDEITMDTTYGTYKYKITHTEVKSGTDQSILAPSDEPILTVYTCYPFEYLGRSPDRFVVIAEQVEGEPLSEAKF